MSPKRPLKKSKSILIVDDSPDLLALYHALLEMHDFEVFTADSGEEGLQRLSEIVHPDLILVDMLLGDMSGVEFVQQLRSQRPDLAPQVPIVFLTGLDAVDTRGVAGVIKKPVDNDRFVDLVEEFIAGPDRVPRRSVS